MKQVVCPNCGAGDFITSSGYIMCSYCGAKFFVEHTDIPKKEVVISLEDDIQMLLKKCKSEPSRARRYANLILDIDPTNIEAKKYLK